MPSAPFLPSPEVNLGLQTWYRNFVNFGSRPYTPRDLATVTCPYHEYFIFSTIKSIQIASFIGGFIVRPFYTSYRYRILKQEEITNNTPKIIRAACKRIQGRLLIGSLLASPFLMWASIYINGYNEEKLAFRCYQIRCDLDLLAYDRATVCCGVVGWFWKRFQGAADLINFALLYTIFNMQINRRFFNPVETDPVLFGKKFANLEDAQFESEPLYRFVKKKLAEKGMLSKEKVDFAESKQQ